MAYRPHLLLTWGGTLGSSEIWSNSLRLTADSTDLPTLEAAARDNIDDLASDVSTFLFTGSVGAYSGYGSAARLTYVKLNAIGADGRYSSDDESNRVDFLTGSPIRTSADHGAFQLAIVVSFKTTAARGRAHAGRLFVPALNASVDDDSGKFPNTIRDAVATSWQGFLQAVNDQPGFDTAGIRAAVFSGIGAPGPARDIVGVTVGNVFDTQRRRRNGLVEDYATVLDVT